jgi:hypothetical protein
VDARDLKETTLKPKTKNHKLQKAFLCILTHPMNRTLVLTLFYLITISSTRAQNKEIYTFIDPVVKSWTVDRKVHAGKKLFASLEMNGNLRVYELQGRKPMFLSIQSEQELGEAGNSSSSRNMLQFSPDGKWLGVFTIRNGFRLYDTETWNVMLDLSWKGVTPATLSETPFPYDIWFMGKHLVLFFEHEEPVNNGFVFDLEKGGIVNVAGSKGFGIYDISSVARHGDSTGIDLDFNIEPKEVHISWNGKPIRSLGRKAKGQFLVITGTEVILHTYEPEADEEEDTDVEEQKKEEVHPVSPLELKFTDSLKRKELQSLLLSYDLKDFFWKADLSPDSNRTYIESTYFQLLSTDTINGCAVSRYDIHPTAPSQLIEITAPGEYPRYFLHSWEGKWLRYGNSVFLHSPPDRYNPTGRWRVVLFEKNEFRWDIFDRDNDDLPGMIVSSPSGKEIAFAVNEYGNAAIYGFSLDSSRLTKILSLPGKKVIDDWLREGGWASYPQLSIYRFLENGYFFFQGKDLGHNNMLFETRYWSKVHELPVAGASRGIRSMGFRNIIRAGESLLFGNMNSWQYTANSFDYTPIDRDSLYENDFIEPTPGTLY